MKRAAALAAAVAAGLAGPAAAEQVWTQTRITAIAAVSDDPKYPQYNDTIYVGFPDQAWLPARCRASPAPGLLASTKDQALLTLALLAFEKKLSVVIKADDERMIGDYCRLFQVTLDTDD